MRDAFESLGSTLGTAEERLYDVVFSGGMAVEDFSVAVEMCLDTSERSSCGFGLFLWLALRCKTMRGRVFSSVEEVVLETGALVGALSLVLELVKEGMFRMAGVVSFEGVLEACSYVPCVDG